MGLFFKALPILLVLTFLFVTVMSEGCAPPPKKYGTNCTDANVQNFLENNTITCSCTFGFVLVDMPTRQCRAEGTWTGSDNLCRIDAVSLALACFIGLSAILIFTTLSCCLISRKRKRDRRPKRRIDRPGNEYAIGEEPGNYTKRYSTKEQSDSGLQTDMDEIDLNDFEVEVESPIDNNQPVFAVFAEG